MTWDDFYDKCFDWAPSTLTRGISQLKELGPADDVVDVAVGVCDEKQAMALVRKQLSMGISFSVDNIQDLFGNISEELLGQAILTVKPPFDENMLELLEEIINEEAAEYVVKLMVRQGYQFTEDQIDSLNHTLSLDTAVKLSDEAIARILDEEILLSDDELFEQELANYPVKKHGFFFNLLTAIGTIEALKWVFSYGGLKKKK